MGVIMKKLLLFLLLTSCGIHLNAMQQNATSAPQGQNKRKRNNPNTQPAAAATASEELGQLNKRRRRCEVGTQTGLEVVITSNKTIFINPAHLEVCQSQFLQIFWQGNFAEQKYTLQNPHPENIIELMKKTLAFVYYQTQALLMQQHTPNQINYRLNNEIRRYFEQNIQQDNLIPFMFIINELKLTVCYNPLAEIICKNFELEQVREHLVKQNGIENPLGIDDKLLSCLKKFILLTYGKAGAGDIGDIAHVTCTLEELDRIKPLNQRFQLQINNTYLDLSARNLPCPLSDITNIEAILKRNFDLTQLTTLILDNHQIQDLTPLERLAQLKYLSLNNGQIQDIPPLAGLTQLEILSLRNNQIQDLTPLARLTQLTELYLDNNQIQDIRPLERLPQLTVLHLSRNQIQDIRPLARLTQLTWLGLANNQIQDFAPIANHPNYSQYQLQ